MRKKCFSMFILMVVFSLVISACSGAKESANNQQNKESNKKETNEKVTLDMWIMPNSPQPDKDMLQILKPYLDEHPNVSVKVTVLDWGSAWSKITTAATSGQGPDILQLGTTWVPAIAAMGALLPITDKVAEIGGKDAYYPASWNTTHIEGQKEIYAVPWFVDARAIYYRKDVFEKAGVNPEEAFKTWDTFKEALKKVNGMVINGKKIAALGVPGKNDWNVVHNIAPWIWAAGGEMVSDDLKSATFNSDKALDGVMYYTGLAAEGLVPKNALEQNSAQVEANYANGDYAVTISGPWLLKNFKTPKAQGGQGETVAAKTSAVFPLPAGPKGTVTFFGGSNLTIFKNSDQPDAAWDIIKFLSSKEAQLAYSQASGQLPALKEALTSSDLTNDPNMDQFVKASENSKSYPSIPQWGAIETVLVKHFGVVWDIVAGVKGKYSRDSVKAELDAAKQEVDSILSQ